MDAEYRLKSCPRCDGDVYLRDDIVSCIACGWSGEMTIERSKTESSSRKYGKGRARAPRQPVKRKR